MTGMQFTFTLADNYFALLGENSATNQFKYCVKKANLIIEKLRVLDSYALSFEKKLLDSGPATFLLPRWRCNSFHIPQNSGTYVVSDMFSQQFAPQYFYVFLTTQQEASGTNLQSSCFNFRHHNIRDIEVTADSTRFPNIPFEPNWTDNLDIRSWLSLYSSTSEAGNFTDEATYVDRARFRSGYAIFCVDLNSSKCLDSTVPKLMSAVKIKLTFSVLTNPNLMMYILSYSLDELFVDSQRQVIRSY